MNLDTAGSGTLLIIGVMAVVTLATRWGGVFVMSLIPINRRVQQFISAMSGSVLIAILTPMAVNGDIGARAALLATALTMLVLRKPLPAITAGIIAAALGRQFFGS
ncbi:AzlD family protein [Oceanisphaera psychrotolerans]|uniref:Branched-chain amino acid transporter n=1 Tax=Oceanisphaera psychrotolerans TaxID=1414654 RepID=A0A1J4QED8_9GAMM|nr:AzlD domain-containing protein [Oceanisphaera psychrotolerans]OIN12169.1 branched-chain amino acid transporter [Oceanisphaera psychrotolerans]